MEYIYLLILFVLGIVIIAIPIIISNSLIRFLKDRIDKTFAYVIGLLPTWIFMYFVYTAFYPTDSFYKEEFKEITGKSFPDSGQIIAKEASYPDFHGDYISAAVITLSNEDYNELLNSIKTDKKLTGTLEAGSNEYQKVRRAISKESDYIYYASIEANDSYYFIGFIDDSKTVVIHKVKS